jgi:hypothetical protein
MRKAIEANELSKDRVIIEGGYEVWYYNKENIPDLVPGAERTYPWGLARRDYSRDPIKSPLRAVREMCLQCVDGNNADVKTCSDYSCPLYPFRFGKNPFHSRKLTKEQRKASLERLKKAREAKG